MTVLVPFPIDPAHGGFMYSMGLPEFGLEPSSRTYASRLAGTVQTEEIAGAIFWAVKTQYRALEGERLYNMQAFVDAMKGEQGRVAYGSPDYLRHGPRGVASGNPKVQSAGQTGRALSIYDVPANVVNWLRKGDLFSWIEGDYREMHRLQIDANSNASGEVTLNFEPPIRRSPPINTPIVTTGATCVMKFRSDEGKIAYNLKRRGTITLDLIEAPVNVA